MVEISKMLIDRGANVNVSYNQGILPIHNSSMLYNGSELINIMVSMGVGVNVRIRAGIHRCVTLLGSEMGIIL
nr:ankyrin repeat protein [Oriental turtle dovepox virus]